MNELLKSKRRDFRKVYGDFLQLFPDDEFQTSAGRSESELGRDFRRGIELYEAKKDNNR